MSQLTWPAYRSEKKRFNLLLIGASCVSVLLSAGISSWTGFGFMKGLYFTAVVCLLGNLMIWHMSRPDLSNIRNMLPIPTRQQAAIEQWVRDRNFYRGVCIFGNAFIILAVQIGTIISTGNIPPMTI